MHFKQTIQLMDEYRYDYFHQENPGALDQLKQFCDELQVVYIPGNHDRLSSFHLAHGLSKCFDDPNITHVDGEVDG